MILMEDINDYIPRKKIRNFATELGLRELFTYTHGLEVPGTTITNKKKQAVDGIWGYQDITISQGGYIPYYFGPKSDNILIWIKIPHLVAFEKKPSLI